MGTSTARGRPSVRGMRCAAVALLGALLGASCGPNLGSDEEPAAEGTSTFEVVFTNINPKTVPVGLEDDEDNKDMKIKRRRKFKASKGSETGLDRRFAFVAKRDDAAACMAFERTVKGDMTTHVRFTVDEADDFVDGETLGFLEARVGEPEAEALEHYRVEAFWNVGIDGLSAHAVVDGEVVPRSQVDFPGVRELFLYIADTGFDTVLSVYKVDEADPEAHDGLGEAFPLHVTGMGLPDPVTIAYGVERLPKKGSLYFAQLVMRAQNAYLGVVEQQIANELAKIYLNTKALQGHASAASAPYFTVLPLAGSMELFHMNAQGLFDAAVADGSLMPLDPGTDAKQLAKNLEKIRWQVAGLVGKIFNKGEDHTEWGFLKGKLKKLLAVLEPTIAQTYGFQKNKSKALDKTAEIIH